MGLRRGLFIRNSHGVLQFEPYIFGRCGSLDRVRWNWWEPNRPKPDSTTRRTTGSLSLSLFSALPYWILFLVQSLHVFVLGNFFFFFVDDVCVWGIEFEGLLFSKFVSWIVAHNVFVRMLEWMRIVEFVGIWTWWV